MDTYTFATSRQIDFPVCIKMYVILYMRLMPFFGVASFQHLELADTDIETTWKESKRQYHIRFY